MKISMDTPLISVIIPVYNIDRYLGRCVESILNQEYKNIEIILVNDGSTDSSPEMIDMYSLKYKNIIAIHQINQGVTSARLKGVSVSHGRFIGFVDGDDYIDSDMYSHLINNAIDFKADISHCGYNMVFHDRQVSYYNTGKKVIQNTIKGLEDLISGKYIEPTLCNKIYKKQLFSDILKKNLMDYSIKNNEDFLMNYYLFKNAKLSIYEDFCPYQYIVRHGSATSNNKYCYTDQIKVSKLILKDTRKIPELYDFSVMRLAGQLVALTEKQFNKANDLEMRELAGKAYRDLKIISKKIIPNNNMPIKFRFKILAAVFFPGFYTALHNAYRRIRRYDNAYSLELK